MRVVGRSGIVLDLDEDLAACLLREGSARPTDDEPDRSDDGDEPSDGGAPTEETEGQADGQGDTPNPAAEEATAPKPAEIRQWAKENGVACPATGRVPRAVLDAYAAATGS